MNYTPEINSIIDQQYQNGGPFWSRDDGDIHAPHGSSTMDTLNVIGFLGANVSEYPILQEAINFLLSYQTNDGSFKYSENSSKLPCMTARIISAISRLGVQNKQTELSYQYLLNTQSTDGGWRCKTVKLGKAPETDASNPGTTLYVLDAFIFRTNSKEDKEKLESGAEFLLQHWESRKPLGPCNFGIGQRFFKIEFPFLRYNLFYYVYVLSHFQSIHHDTRFKAACQTLRNKLINEKVFLENPHRAWKEYDFAQFKKTSDLATSYWHVIEKNMQDSKA